VAEARVGPPGPAISRLDDVHVPALAGPLAVPYHRGQRVRGVPPAGGLPQPGPGLVPALQRFDGLAGPDLVLPRLLRLRPHGYGVGWLSGCPALKCASASTPVTSVSQRVSELRGSRASVTHASAVYQASVQGAASTAGTSRDSRLYRYQATASSSGGHSTPISVDVAAGSSWSPTIWNSRQNDCEITRDDAAGSALSAVVP